MGKTDFTELISVKCNVAAAITFDLVSKESRCNAGFDDR